MISGNFHAFASVRQHKKGVFKEFLKFKKVFRLNRHHFERVRIDEKQHDSVYAKGKSMIFLWCKKNTFC